MTIIFFFWSSKLDLSYYSDNEDLFFGGELVHFLAKEIGLELYAIAYVSLNTYGVIYNHAIQINEGQINLILNELGVKPTNLKSEFDQLNLDEYRHSEYYYLQDKSNRKITDNIIFGYIKNND